MRRRVLGALLFVPAAATAQLATLDFVAPRFDRPALGSVVVELELRPPGVSLDRIEVYLDGTLIGELRQPPWRLVAEAGAQPSEHHLEAIAYSAGEAIAAAGLRTPGLSTDEEITVRLKPLFVTVTQHGEALQTLEREDFAVFDRRRRQSIVTFERGDIPFSAVLLVDASGSMKGGRLEIAVEAAQRFVASLAPLDEVKLILFSHRLLLETPFTSVPAVLGLGLDRVEASGGTTVNDHLFLALHRLEERRGRRVIILLSDGGDIESVLPMERVRELAAQRDVILYWLRLEREQEVLGRIRRSSTWRDADAHDQEMELLRLVVVESGGRESPIDTVGQVSGLLSQLLDELRAQYVLGTSPPWDEPGWHDVEVDVDRRAARGRIEVRAPQGYLVPAAED